jgi:leucyl/phenylalanyl-tRNA---protein transferase
MPVAILTNKLWFPAPETAMSDGLLAIGGDITEDRLLLAYKSGIFPWYYNDSQLPLWWHPNPRFVLFPNKLLVSKSMQQIIKKSVFVFTINSCFSKVMLHCKTIDRPQQDGTWINDTMIEIYDKLHKKGYAISGEVWQNNILVGGLYGVIIGKIFFGESMFSHASNASKFGFIQMIAYLKSIDVALIDCQVYTPHLESLGAEMIDRNLFMSIIKPNVALAF